MKTLWHLTMNTGHGRHSPRSEVYDETLARLQPIIAGNCGPIGEMGLYVDLACPMQGAALMAFHAGDNADGSVVAEAICCWSPLASGAAWKALRARHRHAGEGDATVPSAPATVPWIAVSLRPALQQLPPDIVFSLGDLERCLGWAIIEAHTEVKS